MSRHFAFLSLIMVLMSTTPLDAQPPNVLVFLSDDQRWDTLDAMPIVRARLAARGTTFTEAFVTTPLCCPFRASFLAGGLYAHQTGVRANHEPMGGASTFNAWKTLPLSLQRAGYHTGLIGKYMNGQRQLMPAIPPGWSHWRDTTISPTGAERTWTHYWIARGDSGPERPGLATLTGPFTQYLADREADEAIAFMAKAPSPFFLLIAHAAPHAPAEAAPGDEGAFGGYTYAGRAYGVEPGPDAPAWIRHRAGSWQPGRPFPREQLRSLVGLDRAIGRVLDALETSGQLANTWIFFASDNGFMWGEHRLEGKSVPYDEAVRVPMIVVKPGGAANHVHRGLVAANLEIPATIIAATGIRHDSQGRDVTRILDGETQEVRGAVILQQWADHDERVVGGFGWASVRTRAWKYVEHDEGAVELYDMAGDPYELTNRASDPTVADVRATLAADLANRAGLALGFATLPDATTGVAYNHTLAARYGTPPYLWSAVGLPEGLRIEESGRLRGTPTGPAGEYEVEFRVADTSSRRHAIGPEVVTRIVSLTVR